MSLAARDSEFRRWSGRVDRRICQTFAASPAEPGELPLGFRGTDGGRRVALWSERFLRRIKVLSESGSRHPISRTRHCVGVTPVSLLNATPNELWLAYPRMMAIWVRFKLASWSRVFARSIRWRRIHACGVTPDDCLNAVEKWPVESSPLAAT